MSATSASRPELDELGDLLLAQAVDVHRAARLAKWPMRASRWSGQSGLTQRCCASPSSADQRAAARAGQSVGKRHGLQPFGPQREHRADDLGDDVARLADDDGVARADVLGRTWSSLWSVASPTVDPPTNTGSSTANGVALPVRPIDTWMSLRTVVRSSGGNLKAIAHRGAFDVTPSACCRARSSTFTTTPSIS